MKKILSRIVHRIKGKQTLQDPCVSIRFRDMNFSLMLESWEALPKEKRDSVIAWAKENLWRDVWAYRILAKMHSDKKVFSWKKLS